MTMIAVLDYGIGNLRSAQKGLERVGADARLTADLGLIADADGIVLPGVGAFGPCMAALHEAGLAEVAAVASTTAAATESAATASTASAANGGAPFLGICVGMQLLYEGSEENPGVAGLGVLSGTVCRLPEGVKRPQMQWNELDVVRPSPLLAGLPDPAWVYFVHSYAAPASAADAAHAVATCDYGGPVVAAVEQGRLWATQFHPEKSGANGLRLLANFVALAQCERG